MMKTAMDGLELHLGTSIRNQIKLAVAVVLVQMNVCAAPRLSPHNAIIIEHENDKCSHQVYCLRNTT